MDIKKIDLGQFENLEIESGKGGYSKKAQRKTNSKPTQRKRGKHQRNQ